MDWHVWLFPFVFICFFPLLTQTILSCFLADTHIKAQHINLITPRLEIWSILTKEGLALFFCFKSNKLLEEGLSSLWNIVSLLQHFMYTYMSTCTHALLIIHQHTRNVHMYTYIHSCTHTMHSSQHAHAHIQTHMYIHMHMHTHTHTHTDAHIHKHINTHIQSYVVSWLRSRGLAHVTQDKNHVAVSTAQKRDQQGAGLNTHVELDERCFALLSSLSYTDFPAPGRWLAMDTDFPQELWAWWSRHCCWRKKRDIWSAWITE